MAGNPHGRLPPVRLLASTQIPTLWLGPYVTMRRFLARRLIAE